MHLSFLIKLYLTLIEHVKIHIKISISTTNTAPLYVHDLIQSIPMKEIHLVILTSKTNLFGNFYPFPIYLFLNKKFTIMELY